MAFFIVETIIGEIGLEEKDEKLIRVYLPNEKINKEIRATPLLKKAAKELQQYLCGELERFTLPLELTGSLFMQKVWRELENIAYGTTVTYGEIAQRIAQPRAARAVGMACRRNPLPFFIPCHRVVGSKGKLVGYRGGLELKKWLLKLEVCQI